MPMPEIGASTYKKEMKDLNKIFATATFVIWGSAVFSIIAKYFWPSCVKGATLGDVAFWSAAVAIILWAPFLRAHLHDKAAIDRKDERREFLRSKQGQKIWDDLIHDIKTANMSDTWVLTIWRQFSKDYLEGTDLELSFWEAFKTATGREYLEFPCSRGVSV